MINRSLGR